jgi:hypothetical protein
MSDSFDGLSNLYSISSNVNAFKNAQNSLSNVSKTGSSSQIDPKATILEFEKSFSKMLDNFMFGSTDGTDNSSNGQDALSSFLDQQIASLNSTASQTPSSSQTTTSNQTDSGSGSTSDSVQ